MTDRELDAAIAEKVMEWKHSTNSGWLRQDGTALWESAWRPSTDRNSAALVLERIGELGLSDAWGSALLSEASDASGLTMFEVATATPRQLMEACLKCIETEVG